MERSRVHVSILEHMGDKLMTISYATCDCVSEINLFYETVCFLQNVFKVKQTLEYASVNKFLKPSRIQSNDANARYLYLNWKYNVDLVLPRKSLDFSSDGLTSPVSLLITHMSLLKPQPGPSEREGRDSVIG